MHHQYPPLSHRGETLSGFPLETSDNGSDANSWAVPWSDLMMTMFILFAVLFAFASAKRDFFREIREDIHGVPENVRQELDQPRSRTTKLRTVHRETYTGVQTEQSIGLRPTDDADVLARTMQSPKLIAFTLDRPILFNHLSANLEPKAVSSLRTVLPIIRKSNLEIQVIGYTDGLPVHTPEFEGNWELATARAMTVAHWLMREGNISSSRITVSGRGPNDPRVPNTSRANRIQNRRVEIILTRNRQGTRS
ncbi:OmpA/MotB family protein [Desulfoplanes sp.]